MTKKATSPNPYLFSRSMGLPCDETRRLYERMGTQVEFVVSDEGSHVEPAIATALEEIDRLSTEMSEWREDSVVSEVNRNAGVRPVLISGELFSLVEKALRFSRVSGGAFDITWAALREVWDFKNQRVPSEEEVLRLHSLVDYGEVELDGGREKTVFLRRKGMKMGLGCIAKGYIVDSAAAVLSGRGVENFIVRAGGDMRIEGTKKGEPWSIGVQHPRNRDSLLGRFSIRGGRSVSTSGDYERFFAKEGILYHHILDPSTGFPARLCRSVTIMGRDRSMDTAATDGLSTAVFVLGPMRGLEMIKEIKGVEAVIVDGSGGIHLSPGLRPL